MSTQPFFSDIVGYAKQKIVTDRPGKNKKNSKLSAYVIAANYTKPGLVIISNPNVPLVGSGEALYGDVKSNGSVGRTVGGKTVAPSTTLDDGQGLRPSPIITSLEVEEQNSDDGASNFSRSAKLVIRCFSLGQMEKVVANFLNPGSSIFLQWGWNTDAGGGAYSYGDVASVAKLKDFSNIAYFRKNRDGEADVYLGFVTGGDVSMQNDYWDITVNCKGHMELPAYLMVADNIKTAEQKEAHGGGKVPDPLEYGGNEISAQTDKGLKNWMICFNMLPSNKRTEIVKGLQNRLADEGNFINFDESVKDALNSVTKQGFWKGLFSDSVNVKFGDVKAEIAEDTKLIGDEKFIRFGALMEIINANEVEALNLSGTKVPFAIRSDRTYCVSFEKIFSTDRSKLFIPNKNTPAADFATIAQKGGVQTDFSKLVDNRVSGKTGKYEFPEQSGVSIQIKDAKTANIPAYECGKLDNLYVNFDFAKKILETKSLTVKDALYQILNGMSGAAGSIWDFQIVELEGSDGNQLEIVDYNLTYKDALSKDFTATGLNSSFMEVSLKMDISGQFANQIMLEKSAAAGNSSMPPIKGLFISSTEDMIIKPAEKSKKDRIGKSTDVTGKEDDAERKKRDFATFLGKVGLAPGVKLDSKTAKWPENGDVLSICYQTAFDDLNLFEALKTGKDYQKESSGDMSILLPIDLTLKMHGVSGIKRGDKINIDALPPVYRYPNGFFQVTGVVQNLSDDYWTTDITATFRTTHQKSK